MERLHVVSGRWGHSQFATIVICIRYNIRVSHWHVPNTISVGCKDKWVSFFIRLILKKTNAGHFFSIFFLTKPTQHRYSLYYYTVFIIYRHAYDDCTKSSTDTYYNHRKYRSTVGCRYEWVEFCVRVCVIYYFHITREWYEYVIYNPYLYIHST